MSPVGVDMRRAGLDACGGLLEQLAWVEGVGAEIRCSCPPTSNASSASSVTSMSVGPPGAIEPIIRTLDIRARSVISDLYQRAYPPDRA